MANKMLPSGISVRIREDLIDGVSRTQTTLIIDPIITQGGTRVAMTDIGSIGYGKIDGGTPREEIISWTGITDNTSTYTLTGCVWGVNFHNLSNSTDNYRRHTSGAKFEIKTDMHYIANQFRDNEDNVFTNTDPMEFNSNEIKLGDGTSTLDKVLTADNGDANEPFVKYNETTGKWEISNDGVNSYDPEQGGGGLIAGDAILIDAGSINVKTKETSGVHITDDEVAIEYQTNPGLDIVDNKLGVKVKSGTGLLKDADGIYCDSIDPDNPSVDPTDNAGKLVRLGNDGMISGKLIKKTFGDGFDGDVIISTNTSLARDMYYNNLTIDSGVTLNPNGYRIYVKNTLTNNGTIARNGNNGGNGGNAGSSSHGSAGAAGAALASGTIYGGLAGKNGASGDGVKGTNGEDINPSITNVNGVGGGKGGVSATGSSGGTATLEYSYFEPLPINIVLNSENEVYELIGLIGESSLGLLSSSAGSGSGGTGDVSGSDKTGGGGGSGGNGGIVYISARVIINNGTISVVGGNGGNGGDGYQGDSGQKAGGGGGGGGQGGLIVLIYSSLTTEGTLAVSGGTGGTHGLTTGTDGTNGNSGKYIKILIN